MNKAQEAIGQERVILWKDIDANEPRVAALLRQDFREMVDILPDEMVEKAAGLMLEIPDWSEDYREGEIADFERGKEVLLRNTGADLNYGTEKSASLIRAELHQLAESMSAALLAEGVDVMCSTALLNIPEDMTEEEIADFISGDEEIKRGEYVKWDDVKRTDV